MFFFLLFQLDNTYTHHKTATDNEIYDNLKTMITMTTKEKHAKKKTFGSENGGKWRKLYLYILAGDKESKKKTIERKKTNWPLSLPSHPPLFIVRLFI